MFNTSFIASTRFNHNVIPKVDKPERLIYRTNLLNESLDAWMQALEDHDRENADTVVEDIEIEDG